MAPRDGPAIGSGPGLLVEVGDVVVAVAVLLVVHAAVDAVAGPENQGGQRRGEQGAGQDAA